jgi:hypothetical protein
VEVVVVAVVVVVVVVVGSGSGSIIHFAVVLVSNIVDIVCSKKSEGDILFIFMSKSLFKYR